MRVIADARSLSAVLGACSNVVPSKTPLPIYTNVMLDADAKEKRFEVLVSRGGSLLRWYVPGVDVQRSGRVVVQPGRFADLIAGILGDVTLSFKKGDDELLLSSAPFFEASIAVKHDESEFPWAPPPDLAALPYVVVDRAELIRLVDLCYSGSRGAKDLRYVMDGVTFWPVLGKKPAVEIVGSDGRTLIRSKLPCAVVGDVKERSPASPSLLHNSFVRVLDGVFGSDPSETICLVPGADAVVLKTARSSLRSACGNGSYPDYQDIFKRSQRGSPVSFDVVAADFVHCLRVASICCNVESPTVEVVLGEGTLTASSVVTGELAVGRSRHEMPIAIDGGGARFRISPKTFFSVATAMKEASMIKFAVNLQSHVAFFSCEDISIDGVLVLLS